MRNAKSPWLPLHGRDALTIAVANIERGAYIAFVLGLSRSLAPWRP